MKGFVSSIHVRKPAPKENTLIQHQKVHARERCYECSHCGKLFSHKSCFLAHQRFNCGGMLYDCRNVENPLAKGNTLRLQKSTLEKSLMSARNVVNPLSKSGAYWNTREFTLEKSLISATNVGKFFLLQESNFLAHERLRHWRKPL